MTGPHDPTSSASHRPPRAAPPPAVLSDHDLLDEDVRGLDLELGTILRHDRDRAVPADLVDSVLAASRWRLTAPRDAADRNDDRASTHAFLASDEHDQLPFFGSATTAGVSSSVTAMAADAGARRSLPQTARLPRWMLAGSAIAACLTIGLGAVTMVVMLQSSGSGADDGTAEGTGGLVHADPAVDSDAATGSAGSVPSIGRDNNEAMVASATDPVGDPAAANESSEWPADPFDAGFELATYDIGQRLETFDRELETPMWSRSAWDAQASSRTLASASLSGDGTGVGPDAGGDQGENADDAWWAGATTTAGTGAISSPGSVTATVSAGDTAFRRRIEQMNSDLMAF